VNDEALASLALFEACDANDLAAIGKWLEPREYATGDALMRQGEPGTFFALVVSGAVEITRAGPSGSERLGVADRGSVVGELALLRGRPRSATATALTPTLAAVGDHAAFERLLDLPGVYEHVRHLASARLAENLRPVPVMLRGNERALLRPLLPADRDAFESALRHPSSESLRLRFFTGGQPSSRMIDYLVDIDYVDHFAWVVVDGDDPNAMLAAARYIRHAGDTDQADLAFGVADTHHGRGIATTLLGALGAAASVAGIRVFTAEVLEDNAPMRAVFRKVGAKSTFSEPGVVALSMPVDAAASLLDPAMRREIETAARDVVTAAGLALARPAS
jgi:CRP-like cAMP-binding protein